LQNCQDNYLLASARFFSSLVIDTVAHLSISLKYLSVQNQHLWPLRMSEPHANSGRAGVMHATAHTRGAQGEFVGNQCPQERLVYVSF
jgi:hypothetical protein